MIRRVTMVLAALVVSAAARAQQDAYEIRSKVDIAWNRLHDYDEVVQLCQKLVAAYPELLTMESIGKSVEGRDMWALTLNIKKTGPHDSKPGMYIDANIHGNEVQGAETVLYTIWYLTKSYGHVPQLTELMDGAAFYFIPMVNPDGRAYWFAQPNTAHSSRGGVKPTDNDGDGLFDEDPPNDLDGDGRLLSMRMEDPDGFMRESPDDPRVMIPVDPDDKGDFKRYIFLGWEGIDDDGDGEINEDGVGGYDTNRNWPADWQPNYIQYGSGEFPLSLPESKAIADFILARPNIAAVQSYHNSGGMILRGPGAKYVEYPRADIRVYDRIGKRGEEILPFYRYMIIWKDLYGVHGGTVNWTAEDLGIISFTNELWTSKKYDLSDEEGERTDRMRFADDLMFGQTFVPWKKFEHPELGEIEIGGNVKTTGRVPPPFYLEEECHRNFAFTMFHARQMPKVSITGVEVESLGGGLWRVTADVRNEHLIPTTTEQAAKRRYGPRDRVEIGGDALRVVAGGTVSRRRPGAPLEFVEHQPSRIWLDHGIRGETTRRFQWLVEGDGAANIRVSGPRFVNVSKTVELK
ncbi:MAG: peptidase M14 [Planctomycetota bacterium]|nr:MAG: peptidase M14 [Planctomycetota bacterium]